MMEKGNTTHYPSRERSSRTPRFLRVEGSAFPLGLSDPAQTAEFWGLDSTSTEMFTTFSGFPISKTTGGNGK
jgi:hypothetical protein